MENQPFPKQVYLWGSILEKIDWTRWWARWAWLGADLALLGALGWVGMGCWPRWLGWLGVVLGVEFGRAGRAGWVGRGVGRAGRAGWVGRGVGRAGWVGVVLGVGLAVLGALAGLVGCGVGRGVWPCWARWLGRAWCWGFGRAGRAGWVGRGVGMLGALAN